MGDAIHGSKAGGVDVIHGAGVAVRDRTLVLLVALLAVAVALGVAVTAASGIFLGIAVCIPCLLGWVRRGNGDYLIAPALLLFAVFYLLTVPLRALGIVLAHYSGVEFAINPVSPAMLDSVLIERALGITCLLAVCRVIIGRRRRRLLYSVPERPSELESVTWNSRRRVMTLLCVVASLGGLALIVVSSHGFTAASQFLAIHNKENNLSGLGHYGLALWSIFSLPASWLLGANVVQADAKRRGLSMFCLLILVLSMVFVFGSRLQPVLAGIGIWVTWAWYGKRMSRNVVLLTAGILIVASPALVAMRTHHSQQATKSITQIAGYGILDASLAVEQQPDEVASYVRSASRWRSFLPDMLPNVLSGGANTSTSTGLDSEVANQFGDINQQGTTGLPTSYATELSLLGGMAAIIIGSAMVGAVLGYLLTILIDQGSGFGRRGPEKMLLLALSVVSVFTYVKDGDIVTTFSTYFRTCIYLLLLFGLAHVISVRNWFWLERENEEASG